MANPPQTLRALGRLCSRSTAVCIAASMVALWGLQLKGLLGVLCTVRVEVLYLDSAVINFGLLDFTFSQMAHDFWAAGAWLIALLVVAGSVFPLAKLAALMVLWTLDLPNVSRGARRRTLLALDLLGHAYTANIIFIAIVVLNLSHEVRLGPRTLVKVAAELSREGIWLGGGVSTAIQGLGQVLLFVERSGASRPQQCLGATMSVGGAPVALCKSLPRSSTLGLAALAVAFCVCFAAGLLAPIATFEFGGLAGAVVRGEEVLTALTLVAELPGHSPHTLGGAYFLCAVLSLVLVAAPAATALACVACWVVPLTAAQQRFAVVAIERLVAWCAVDVLVLSTVAAVSEMNLVANFTIKSKLSLLCEDALPALGSECVVLRGTAGIGVLWLGAAATVLLALVVYTRWYLRDDADAHGASSGAQSTPLLDEVVWRGE